MLNFADYLCNSIYFFYSVSFRKVQNKIKILLLVNITLNLSPSFLKLHFKIIIDLWEVTKTLPHVLLTKLIQTLALVNL